MIFLSGICQIIIIFSFQLFVFRAGRSVCESCIKSGVSSCSSALSSLESGGSRETGSSRETESSRGETGSSRGESGSSRGESGSSRGECDSGHHAASLSSSQQHYIKMTGLKSRQQPPPHYAKCIKQFSSKPYQTLEVSLQGEI